MGFSSSINPFISALPMNGTLPNWMQRLLGVEIAPGEGASWSVDYCWPWPPWLTFVLAVAVVVYVLWLYWHETPTVGRCWRIGLAAVRLAILATLLLMISRATLLLQRTGLPCVAMLIDDSQSMGIVDGFEPKTQEQLRGMLQHAGLSENLDRLNLAKSVLLQKDATLLRGIQKEHKLRLYSLTGGEIDVPAASPSTRKTRLQHLLQNVRDLQATGAVTRLGAGVAAVLDDLRGSTPTAIIIISDGINTEGPSLAEAAAAARRRGVPLFTVGIGDRRPFRDLQLSDLLVDAVVFVDDVVSFQFDLSGVGFAGREVEVQLKEKGKAGVLASKKLRIEADEKPQSVRLLYRPPAEGDFRYRVELLPLEGELRQDNNAQERSVRVRKQKIRVLLAAGQPNYEFRYLRNMLARDNNIQLHTVLQNADIKAAQQDATALNVFPVRREELFSYDVIILDDVDKRLLGDAAMKAIVDFVSLPEKGGALIFIAGPQNMPQAFADTPLTELLPIKLGNIDAEPQTDVEGFVARPTDLGLANPGMQLGETPNETLEIWRRLPPLYWMVGVADLKMGTMVLAVNPRRKSPDGHPLPLICMQYVGAGKVLFHASDETWRWRWRAGDTFFARYWLQMIRYLSRTKLFDRAGLAMLETDQREYRSGQPVRIRLRFSDPRQAPADERDVSVIVEQQGQPNRSISLHRIAARELFEGLLTAATPGQYHVWLASPTIEARTPAVDFQVLPPVGELENLRMDAAAMKQAARQTQGRFYSLLQSDRLFEDLPPGCQVPTAALPPLPLWNRWPLLALLLGLLIAEWTVRKCKSMA